MKPLSSYPSVFLKTSFEMKSSVCIWTIVCFQACLLQTALALPSLALVPAQSSKFFEEWLATFDPNTPGQRNSALCENAGDGFYAFPDNPNCNPNYYACIGGVQYNQTCPGNSVFEPALGNCLNPDTAPSCKVTTTTPVTTTTVSTSPVTTTTVSTTPVTTTTVKTTTTTTTPFSCTSDGFFPVGTCSTSYYACVGGIIYPQTCPGNGIFDPSISACVAPESLPSCPPITSTVPITTTIPSTSTVTTPSTTVATTTLTSTTTAPPTTTTTAPPTTTTTITTTPSTGTTIFTCTEDGFFPMGSCLSTYYACVGGISYVQTCPGNGIFVETKCVTPQNVTGCDTTTSTSTTITSTTTSTTMSSSTTTASTTTAVSSVAPFTCPTPEGFYPIPGTCSADYYICVSGSPYVQTCPAGIFDPVLLKCVLPETASPPCTVTTIPPTTTPTTTSTTTPTTTPTTTTAAPFVCPGTGQYPYPGSCTLYYVCGGGTYFVASCPIGQVFNPDTKYCEPPINVPGCYFSFVDFYQGMKLVGLKGGQPQQ